MKQIEAVIFDWAGTTVDYGCMAPIMAMEKAFSETIPVTLSEIRKPMGMSKREHIAAILQTPRVQTAFKAKYHCDPKAEDLDKIYQRFEMKVFSVLNNFTTLIDGVLAVQTNLRQQNIKIGSTTGYTKAMMDIVAKSAREQGYEPSYIATADKIGYGRPYPYMLQQNLLALNVKDVRQVLKVGDTLVDIEEGLHAGCWSIGVIKGSSMLGLQIDEVANLPSNNLQQRMQEVRDEMLSAGAHYVLDSIDELPQVIDLIRKV